MGDGAASGRDASGTAFPADGKADTTERTLGRPARAALWFAAVGTIGFGLVLLAGVSRPVPPPPSPVPEHPAIGTGAALPSDSEAVLIELRRDRITRVLWLITAALSVLGIIQLLLAPLAEGTEWAKYLSLFGLDAEQSLHAWFSSMIMAGAALLCFVASRSARVHDPANRRGWFALSLIFIYLSFDEAASVHEKVSWTIQNTYNLRGIFYFSWVFVALPIVAVLAFLFSRFLRRLTPPTGNRIVVAGVVFLAGALGFEVIGGLVVDKLGIGFWYWAEGVAEETFELAGLVLFTSAILDYLAFARRPVTFDFAPP